jgi:hypothetical protein
VGLYDDALNPGAAALSYILALQAASQARIACPAGPAAAADHAEPCGVPTNPLCA